MCKGGRNEDLLTERPMLGIPRLCHNAQTDLLRKQQVRSSNLRVGSSSPSRSESPVQPANLVSGVCHNADDLLTERFPERHTRGPGVHEASQWCDVLMFRSRKALLSSTQQVHAARTLEYPPQLAPHVRIAPLMTTRYGRGVGAPACWATSHSAGGRCRP